MVLLDTVFTPWRWSPECLKQVDKWIREVRHPNCLKAYGKWLALLHIAAESKEDGLDAAFVPPIPEWAPELVPDVSWLPRDRADNLVLSALTNAARVSRQTKEVITLARNFLVKEVETLSEVYSKGDRALKDSFESLGDSLTQRLGDKPEAALREIDKERWNGGLVAALMHWARHSLSEWEGHRPDASLVLHTTCISQLSLLACLADMWPNAVRHAAMYAPIEIALSRSPSWPKLLCNVIRYFKNDRIVQAAWSLLGRVAGPDLPADDLWAALRCSMKDKPIIRDRALAVLSSTEGKSLVAALSSESIRVALNRWTEEPSGQTVLAIARVFGILSREPALDPRLRQEIQSRLRELALHPDSHRPVFRMAGMGGKGDAAFKIVGENFLDEQLRTLDLELLGEMASGF